MTAGAFEAFSEGRTLHFTQGGAPFGSEQFFAGRRTLWRFPDGRCEEGVWREVAGLVCFDYDDGQAEACWRLLERPGGLGAALVEDGAETGLVVEMSGADQTPLDCPGPDVGS